LDWHGDKKAPASKFYPTKGRKGKKMTGKPGHDELVGERDAKWYDKWMDAYCKRHGVYPPDDVRYEVMRTHRLRAEYERLMETGTTYVVDRDLSDMTADGRDPVAYLKESIERMKAEEAEEKKARGLVQDNPDDAERRQRRWDLRLKCPIPVDMMRKLKDGKMSRELLMEAYEVSADDFSLYYDAMFGPD
jgi:hypothetical protein